MEKWTRASSNQTQTSVYILGRPFYALSFLTCLTCLLSLFLFLFDFLVQSSVLSNSESDINGKWYVTLFYYLFAVFGFLLWLRSLNCAKIDQYCIIFNWFPMNFDFSISFLLITVWLFQLWVVVTNQKSVRNFYIFFPLKNRKTT